MNGACYFPFPDAPCEAHGNPRGSSEVVCLTTDVLLEVRAERERQFTRYGTNNDFEDGTGPGVRWLLTTGTVTLDEQRADDIEVAFRREYADAGGDKGVDWMRLVREEVAEAFAEDDPERLQDELIQVAALCVSWVESIRLRPKD